MRVINFDQKVFEKFLKTQLNKILDIDDNCLVVGIQEGGMPLADILHNIIKSNDINTELIGVKCQRPLTKVKKKNKLVQSLVRLIFKIMPRFVLNFLRNVEHHFFVSKNVNTSREVIILNDVNFNQYDKILIIDDAIDSGHSMQNVLKEIREKTTTQIFTFSVVVTNKKTCFWPDFYLHSGVLIRFPWSLDG